MSVAEGPDGDVYIPVVYASEDTLTDAQRLGRETDWSQSDGGPVRGIGQRILLMGEDGAGIMELGAIQFGA